MANSPTSLLTVLSDFAIRAAVTLLFTLTVASRSWAQDPAIPTIGETLGSQIGKAIDAVVEHKANKAYLSAQIRQARRDYFRQFPDKPGVKAAGARFNELLQVKDLYHLEIQLAGNAADPFGQYGALGRIMQLEQLSGGELDGGIPDAAESAFNGWVAAITWQFGGRISGASKAQLISAIREAEPEYAKYRKARDKAEFLRAGISPEQLAKLHARQEERKRQREARRRAEQAAAAARLKAQTALIERCETLTGTLKILDCKLAGCAEPDPVMNPGQCRSLRGKAVPLRLEKRKKAEKAEKERRLNANAKPLFERRLAEHIARNCRARQWSDELCQERGRQARLRCEAKHPAEPFAKPGRSPYRDPQLLDRSMDCLDQAFFKADQAKRRQQTIDETAANTFGIWCRSKMDSAAPDIDRESPAYAKAHNACVEAAKAELMVCMDRRFAAAPAAHDSSDQAVMPDTYSAVIECSESVQRAPGGDLFDRQVLRPYCTRQAKQQAAQPAPSFDMQAALAGCPQEPIDALFACQMAATKQAAESHRTQQARKAPNAVGDAAERCVERLQAVKYACLGRHHAAATDEQAYMAAIGRCIDES